MLEKLTSLHARLFAALSELDCATRELTPDRSLLAEVRWNLTRASIERTRFLEEELYPFLLRTLSAAEAEPVRKLKEDGVRLRALSSAHIGCWPIETVAADWRHYCNASRNMRASMRRRIGEEQSVLFPLLASAGFSLPLVQASAA